MCGGGNTKQDSHTFYPSQFFSEATVDLFVLYFTGSRYQSRLQACAIGHSTRPRYYHLNAPADTLFPPQLWHWR